MDIVSVLIFKLEANIIRIKEIYSYIFKFFLPARPEGDEENDRFFNRNTDYIQL